MIESTVSPDRRVAEWVLALPQGAWVSASHNFCLPISSPATNCLRILWLLRVTAPTVRKALTREFCCSRAASFNHLHLKSASFQRMRFRTQLNPQLTSLNLSGWSL